MSNAERVKASLSGRPMPADWIAAKTGIAVENVYVELVRLYDTCQAEIIRCPDPYSYKAEGWVLA